MTWYILCPAGNMYSSGSFGSIFFGVFITLLLIGVIYAFIRVLDYDGTKKFYLYVLILFVIIVLILNLYLWNSNPVGYY